MNRYALGFALTFSALSARAHVPKPAQIARFQPNVLRNQKAFQIAGTLTSPLGKADYSVDWMSPGRYDVRVANLPGKFYSNGEGTASLQIYRQGNRCILRTDRITTTCPAPRSWALLEWGAQPDLTANTLKSEGFFAEEDVPWTESHSADPPAKDPASKRIHLAVGRNGSAPVAVLEIRGPQLQVDSSGDTFPVIHFDQTFLAPLLQRFSSASEIVTISATSDLSVTREQPRFSHIVAARLEVGAGGRSWLSLQRKEPTSSREKAEKLPQAITDVTSLEAQLSPEGLQVLRALLLTH